MLKKFTLALLVIGAFQFIIGLWFADMFLPYIASILDIPKGEEYIVEEYIGKIWLTELVIGIACIVAMIVQKLSSTK